MISIRHLKMVELVDGTDGEARIFTRSFLFVQEVPTGCKRYMPSAYLTNLKDNMYILINISSLCLLNLRFIFGRLIASESQFSASSARLLNQPNKILNLLKINF